MFSILFYSLDLSLNSLSQIALLITVFEEYFKKKEHINKAIDLKIVAEKKQELIKDFRNIDEGT